VFRTHANPVKASGDRSGGPETCPKMRPDVAVQKPTDTLLAGGVQIRMKSEAVRFSADL